MILSSFHLDYYGDHRYWSKVQEQIFCYGSKNPFTNLSPKDVPISTGFVKFLTTPGVSRTQVCSIRTQSKMVLMMMKLRVVDLHKEGWPIAGIPSGHAVCRKSF